MSQSMGLSTEQRNDRSNCLQTQEDTALQKSYREAAALQAGARADLKNMSDHESSLWRY